MDASLGWTRNQEQNFLDILEDYEDTDVVDTVSNTYYIHSQYFMQFGRKGFVDLGNLDSIIEPDDEEEDEEEELFEQSNQQQTEGGNND